MRMIIRLTQTIPAIVLSLFLTGPLLAAQVDKQTASGPSELAVAQKRATSIAGWWKHKFKTDPSFSGIPFTYYSGNALRQHSSEEESR